MKLTRTIARPAAAITLAVSLAMSPVTAKPAQAGEAELFIAGAIGTVLLGAIAADALNNKGRVVYAAPQSQGHQGGYRGHYPAPKVIPAGCQAPRFSHARNTYFRADCIQRNMRGATLPPNYCKTTVIKHRNGNHRALYDGNCLSRAGYKVAGARGHYR